MGDGKAIAGGGAQRIARLVDGDEARVSFLAALSAGDAARPAVVWLGERPAPAPFATLPSAPWQPSFVDAVAAGERPGQSPEHESGALYCLDLSSVFEAAPLAQLPAAPRLVVDVCASPGGKSVLAWRHLAPEHLVCNEAVGKRVAALRSNLTRCGLDRTTLTNLDPARLAPNFVDAAEVVLVDAPCSGQSLVARGVDNPGCFHEVTIGQNAGRQKRILAESLKMVAPGGWLLYTTCTFARDENEGVVKWLLGRFDGFSAVEVPALAAHRSPLAEFPTYRLWPHEGFGAGGFCCLLRRD